MQHTIEQSRGHYVGSGGTPCGDAGVGLTAIMDSPSFWSNASVCGMASTPNMHVWRHARLIQRAGAIVVMPRIEPNDVAVIKVPLTL